MHTFKELGVTKCPIIIKLTVAKQKQKNNYIE